MIPITDIVVIAFLVVLVMNGWHLGALRALIGPVSIIAATLLALALYNATQNFSASFLVGLIGPFLIGWTITSLLNQWQARYAGTLPGTISRVASTIICVTWGSLTAGLIVIFLAFFPFEMFNMANVNKDVRRSVSYTVSSAAMAKLFWDGRSPKDLPCSSCEMNAVTTQEANDILSDADVQAIMNDPRVQSLINDPDMQKALEQKNVSKLLANAAVKDMAQDPAFIMKVLKVYPKIQALKDKK